MVLPGCGRKEREALFRIVAAKGNLLAFLVGELDGFAVIAAIALLAQAERFLDGYDAWQAAA